MYRFASFNFKQPLLVSSVYDNDLCVIKNWLQTNWLRRSWLTGVCRFSWAKRKTFQLLKETQLWTAFNTSVDLQRAYYIKLPLPFEPPPSIVKYLKLNFLFSIYNVWFIPLFLLDLKILVFLRPRLVKKT